MATDAVTFRLARASDAPAMAAMTRSLIEAGLPPRYTEHRMARLIASREHTALAAVGADGVQGFAIMQFGDERAHLVLLGVSAPLQRGGIGRALVEWLVESAQVAGIASIHLELRADNVGAKAFYESLGFSETLVVPGYYEGRIAARRMIRVLRVQAASPG
ncbi:GNAT family N-acetyltransferase [Caenimonas sedimenti]|uniref:GNAT family N-acetyltransferase n=1 Tax=Caenimonas sedimenti TaxID=2596921 RepID=A0A562ZVY6_9BURK|nr:GNAT family N-acetyltransferase [Caenimonas sedimenti]TWO72465.1 GNAT family N-acetyltransferase [Caenimonas sedimenti]